LAFSGRDSEPVERGVVAIGCHNVAVEVLPDPNHGVAMPAHQHALAEAGVWWTVRRANGFLFNAKHAETRKERRWKERSAARVPPLLFCVLCVFCVFCVE
jgi:hypothetical protein